MAAGESLSNLRRARVFLKPKLVGNINDDTLLSHHRNLRILFEYLNNHPNPYSWKFPIENIRPTLDWSSFWCPKDNAMLPVGVFICGIDKWEAIQKDLNGGSLLSWQESEVCSTYQI